MSLLQRSPSGRRTVRRSPRRFLLFLCILPPLVFLFLLVLGAVLALEDQPLVHGEGSASVDDAVRVRQLAKKGIRLLYGKKESATLEVSEDELNGLMILAARGVERFSGRVRLQERGMLSSMTMELPANPLGKYLNLQVNVLPSRDGLVVEEVRFGRLTISGEMAVVVLRALLDLGLGRGEGRAVLASLEGVDFSPGEARLHIREISHLRQSLKKLKGRALTLRDEIIPLGPAAADPALVRLYRERLRAEMRAESVSLAEYMKPLFQLARERSADGDPVAENRAALLALAIDLGHWRFSHLVGGGALERSGKFKATLAGRTDLRLHFVVSAGLKLLSDQGLSFAVGEAKELLDAGKGGSGFSFIDLAADRAGVRLATVATDPARARRLQVLLADGGEALFFPVVADLPENLDQGDFEARFGKVGSLAYEEMVREIDSRLDRSPAYSPL